jgi:transposase
MARPFKGVEVLDSALSLLSKASSVEQMRQLQAVVFPLRYGLSLAQTAEALGVSQGWASHLRNAFLAGRMIDETTAAARGGRRRQSFTPEREAELLEPFIEKAASGGILVVGQLKPILEKARGKPLALATVYNLLHRHGWRKLAPDKRHPQSDPVAQEAFKKNSPRRSAKSDRASPKVRRSG